VQGVVVDAYVRRVFVVGEVTDDLEAVGRTIRFHQRLVEMLISLVDAVGIQVGAVGWPGVRVRLCVFACAVVLDGWLVVNFDC